MDFVISNHTSRHGFTVKIKGDPINLNDTVYTLDSFTCEFEGGLNTSLRIYLRPKGDRHMLVPVSLVALPEDLRGEITRYVEGIAEKIRTEV